MPLSPQDVLRGVAAYGLPDHDQASLAGPLEPPEPLDPTSWSELLELVAAQRLVGYLQWAVDAGAFPVTPAQREAVEALHLRWCATVLRLERVLLGLADELDAAGMRFLVLKGTASAHLVHQAPNVRMFGDNDLLFPADDFERALQVLRGLGYRRTAPSASAAFDRRFGKGATLLGPDGDELDAHRNLVFGTFGFAIDLDELFTSAVPFELGGRQLWALGPETRLMHACYHAALGDPIPRLSSLRDVAQMLCSGSFDPSQLLEVAQRWRSRAVVARAVALCRAHLGLTLRGPMTALERYEPTRRERRAIDSYVGTNRSFAAKVTASLPYLQGVGDRVAFVRSALTPSPALVESLGHRPGFDWLRRGIGSRWRGRER